MEITKELISILIAAAGLAASIYFSLKNVRRSMDAQKAEMNAERERRQESLIKKAEKDTERHTQIVERLNTLLQSTAENKREIEELRSELREIAERMAASDETTKTLFRRLEAVEENLKKLHSDYRGHVTAHELREV